MSTQGIINIIEREYKVKLSPAGKSIILVLSRDYHFDAIMCMQALRLIKEETFGFGAVEDFPYEQLERCYFIDE